MLTVRPACADRAIASIDQALGTLDALAAGLRGRADPQPIIAPLTIASLRGLLQHARAQVRDAITTGAPEIIDAQH